MVRETKYAKVISEAVIGPENGHQARAERLIVKEKGTEELRFSWWYQGKFMPRPLDMEEKEWIKLFKAAIEEGVFSHEFIQSLKDILPL